jgi:hypothetical protein
MSSFAKMNLREALPQIEKLFESFGTKSMIIKKNTEWVSAVTIIQFTRRTVNDLNNEYRFLEERLSKIDYDNFKIILQARPIQEFHAALTELQNGFLKIGEIQTKLLPKSSQGIANQRMGRGVGGISRIGEYAEYDFFGISMGMDADSYNEILPDVQACASSSGLRDQDELLRSWFDLDSFYQTTSLCILVPIYAAVREIQYQGGNEVKVALKIDESLFENSHVWLTRAAQGDRVPIADRQQYELASCENTLQDGFFHITFGHRFSAINVYDKVSVTISNNALGVLARKEETISNFPSEASNPFLKVFSLFDSGMRIEEHLLYPKEAEDLVSAFSWLLEMIGISSLQLGRDENIREEGIEKGSADIIASYRESTLLNIIVIDCTIAVPSEHKIDKIKNTAEYVSRKIGFPVKAVIVTSEKSSLTKEQGQKHAVKIIDYTDLEKILGFYKKGYDYPARQIILGTN